MSLVGRDPVAGQFFSRRRPLLPSWRRPWISWCLVACLAAGSGGRADEVGLADGTVVRGTILRIRPDGILFLTADGTLRAAAVDQDQRFTLDLHAGPRCVHVVDRDGRRRLVSVKVCAERRLSGTDMEGRSAGYDLVGERFIIHDPGRWPQWEISFPAFVHHRKNASGRLCQVEFALFRTWNTAANAEFPATLVALGERTIRVQPAAGDAIELPIDALRGNELFKRLLAERDRIVAEFLTQATTMLLDRLGKTHAVVSSADDPYVVIAAGGAAAGKQTTGILRTIADLHGKTLFTNQARGGFIVVLTDDAEAFAALRGGGPEASGSAGFYNHGTRTLVIRRGTGTGTIAHEFTHALHFADMEALGQIHPIWIREGLGSLYEESDPRADRLVGLVNWRLPLLKKALAEGRTFPLRAFLENSERCFTEQTGVAYAMARYLCFFLQEKQVLGPRYARYCRNFADDRNGVRSLEEAYGKPLDQIEADWIEFVKSLP